MQKKFFVYNFIVFILIEFQEHKYLMTKTCSFMYNPIKFYTFLALRFLQGR